ERLIARADTAELEARGRVLDRGVGELDHRLVDLAALLHGLARARAEEVLVVVALELRDLELEHAQVVVDRLGRHAGLPTSPCRGPPSLGPLMVFARLRLAARDLRSLRAGRHQIARA